MISLIHGKIMDNHLRCACERLNISKNENKILISYCVQVPLKNF